MKNVPCTQEPTEVFVARVAQYVDPDGLVLSVGEEERGSQQINSRRSFTVQCGPSNLVRPFDRTHPKPPMCVGLLWNFTLTPFVHVLKDELDQL